ncbi:cytidylyltransferase domain-containing protein [Edwardsiella tarda]|uniref:cytidylyltransferase domain-containing protein n=1 Tax=Edwardsiella tarda TaxID=636 RepID=UPI00351CA161
MAQTKIAIIPARSGSKGLSNKNILMLLDKPLIAYTIEAAILSGLFSRVIVSTDSLEYKRIAESYGAEVILREDRLSSDTATSFMVIEDVLNRITGFDYFVLLQPTSPFRSALHIQQAILAFESQTKFNYLVSVVESDKSSNLIRAIDDDLSLKHFDSDFRCYRRQNKKEYTPNGAIFIGKPAHYLNKKSFFGHDSLAYFMDKIDSVDIDDRLDFELAICIQKQRVKEKELKDKILRRIEEKSILMRIASPITLIGHSLFDNWNIEKIKEIKVNNLGIAGINTREYNRFILDKGMIKEIGDKVIIFAGTNDMVIDGWVPELTYQWVVEMISLLKKINKNARFFLISVPPVRGRLDRDNNIISNLNNVLRSLKDTISNVNWIELSDSFYDDFGNLPSEFTYDGLHFTEKAYAQLESEIEDVI